MNHEYEDLDAAIRGDTARLRDHDGSVFRPLAYGLMAIAVVAVCLYAAKIAGGL